MPAELILRLTAEEAGSADFLDADAEVSCRGFTGRTRFPIARRDLVSFAADIAALQSGAADRARLLGGWDTAAERLRLEVTRAGAMDSFTIRVRIANSGPRTDHWDRIETQFVCETNAVMGFAEAASRGGTSRLVGDEESTA